MAIKASSQIQLVDLTDGYSVILTNENHTFLGDTDSVASTQSTTCMVQALCGAEQVPCTIGTMTCPTGLTIVSDGKTPVPTLTITATTALKTSGSVMIPVVIGEITIQKAFSYSIAFKGNTGSTGSSGKGITSIVSHYLATTASSGVTTGTAGWTETMQTTTTSKKYLWFYQTINYTTGSPTDTTPVIIGTHGATGATGGTGATGKGVKSVVNYFLTTSSGSGITNETSGFDTTPDPTTTTNRYTWMYQLITYTDNSTSKTTAVIISTHGATGGTGAPGKDALLLVVTSSGGQFFKNTAIATTLTAHVYKGGVELTGTALTNEGTIKWYKDAETTASATGTTLAIQPGDVANTANYTAKLEG